MSLTPGALTSQLSGLVSDPASAAKSGEAFDVSGSLFAPPAPVGGELDTKKLKTDISVKRKSLKGLDFGGSEEGDEEDAPLDATADLKTYMRNIGTPVKTPELSSGQTQLASVDNSFTYDPSEEMGGLDIPTNIGVVEGSSALAKGFREREAYDPSADYKDFFPSVKEDSAAQTAQNVQTAVGVGKAGLDLVGFFNKKPIAPVTTVFGKTLPGYKGPTPTGAPTAVGQLTGLGTAAAGAYTTYSALKGGIDNPLEGAQAVGGVMTTLGGLQSAGFIAGSQFAALMGPIGIAMAGVSLLSSKGGLFGGGKSKPPMGGVEFRLVDDAGKQYTNVQEGQKRRIKAVNAHSYNGYNAGALQAQANKNVDYMYAFADEFGLKVNESAWANAAFGPNKYMPRGREAPYRSVLERIDSAGDGSVSPGEWLRHAMEYEGPNGQRILEGQVYKGVRIGQNGMPVKVGYRTQEEFENAVSEFNKKYFA